MNLTDYIADMDRRQRLAAAVDTSPDYLWQVASAWNGRRASTDLAQAIEAATGGEVRCDDVRPDLQWMRGADGRVTGYFVPADKVA